MNARFSTVIFDLGDVLFTWSASTPQSPLPSKVTRGILRSAQWFEYEKGNLSEDQAYAAVAEEFGVQASDVKGGFIAARNSLRSDPTLLGLIREIKNTGRKVYAMSNISAPDWEFLRTRAKPSEWALFDRVFTSAEARERKPNVGFYQHVIDSTGLNPAKTIFVDDKIENVLTARSFGVHGIVFDNLQNVVRQLKNLCDDPVDRAMDYLHAHKKRLISVTSNGIELKENFAQMLILEATHDETLVDFEEHHEGKYNFFRGTGMLTTEKFPDDLDTTSIGLTVDTRVDPETKQRVMNEMLSYRNKDGIVQVYFDRKRPRIDPVACANILTFFYRNGRGRELGETLDWVEQVLIHRACSSGSLYYHTQEQFFFFLSRLIQSSAEVRQRLGATFKQRVSERLGAEGDALMLAMRVISAAVVGVIARYDLDRLLDMQEEDGSWKNGWFYKYGSTGLLIGNDGVTTALAVEAINAVKALQEGQPLKHF